MMGNKIVLNLPFEDLDLGKLKKWLGRACWVPSCHSFDSIFHIWFPKLSSHQAFLNCEKSIRLSMRMTVFASMHAWVCTLCVCVRMPKAVSCNFTVSRKWKMILFTKVFIGITWSAWFHALVVQSESFPLWLELLHHARCF